MKQIIASALTIAVIVAFFLEMLAVFGRQDPVLFQEYPGDPGQTIQQIFEHHLNTRT